MSTGDDFIGSGWDFPIRTDSRSGIALVSRDQEIEKSMKVIIGTAPGERPMRPEFGCAIHEHVFDATSTTVLGRIAHEVQTALRRWEPRIDVREVIVTPDSDSDDNSLLRIGVSYTIRDTNDPRNLVYPFYVIPGERRDTGAASAGLGSGEVRI